jgi:peptidoglycan/xylan/chitin deacetylase (PgdA/CDA1 family)
MPAACSCDTTAAALVLDVQLDRVDDALPCHLQHRFAQRGGRPRHAGHVHGTHAGVAGAHRFLVGGGVARGVPRHDPDGAGRGGERDGELPVVVDPRGVAVDGHGVRPADLSPQRHGFAQVLDRLHRDRQVRRGAVDREPARELEVGQQAVAQPGGQGVGAVAQPGVGEQDPVTQPACPRGPPVDEQLDVAPAPDTDPAQPLAAQHRPRLETGEGGEVVDYSILERHEEGGSRNGSRAHHHHAATGPRPTSHLLSSTSLAHHPVWTCHAETGRNPHSPDRGTLLLRCNGFGRMVAGVRRPLTLAVLAAVLATAACTRTSATVGTPPASTTRAVASSSAPPDPAAVGANELGLVPVLMYHRLVPNPAGVYDRTPDEFRAELVRLAREGYVPVTAARYVAGEIDVPAGTHPVVLTFDDGDPTQFALTPAGEAAPGTAVAILREVAAGYPSFHPVATFYINADPFGDPGGRRTLPGLREHGMEIGNHTWSHANLGQASPAQVRDEILREDQLIRAAVPSAPPATLALPFGVSPDDPGVALRGDGYQYSGVFLVGSNPAPSPYATAFDPARIPRIRSQAATGEDAEYCSTVWLDKLAAAPGELFTSDGVAKRVSYPANTTQAPAAAFASRAVPYTP